MLPTKGGGGKKSDRANRPQGRTFSDCAPPAATELSVDGGTEATCQALRTIVELT